MNGSALAAIRRRFPPAPSKPLKHIPEIAPVVATMPRAVAEAALLELDRRALGFRRDAWETTDDVDRLHWRRKASELGQAAEALRAALDRAEPPLPPIFAEGEVP